VSIDTVKQAKRFVKILVGFTLLLLGAIMLVTPGPGWVAIGFGLALLAAEFVWARRLLNRLKAEGTRLRDAVLPSSPPAHKG
jgi:uncharacterized protein (TIGR02611 family)